MISYELPFVQLAPFLLFQEYSAKYRILSIKKYLKLNLSEMIELIGSKEARNNFLGLATLFLQ